MAKNYYTRKLTSYRIKSFLDILPTLDHLNKRHPDIYKDVTKARVVLDVREYWKTGNIFGIAKKQKHI